ncbi:hypothetical protein PsorP6_018872 [Peronosclerospora sorghi]|nr:hypothetical protein PsorP6_018872 [Peronosclerospora sorghi]
MQFNGKPPGPRFCYVGTFYGSSIVIFGGCDGSNRLNDFKRFRFEEEKFQLDIPESTLIDDLRMLVNNDVMSDVTFVGTRKQDGGSLCMVFLTAVEGIPVYGNQILCIRCSYFKAMLTGELICSCTGITNIKLKIYFRELIYSAICEFNRRSECIATE